MNKKLILTSTLLLSSSALLACSEDIDSSDVRTSGFYPEFIAVATGDGSTNVTARLKTGGKNSNTFADLRDPDVLRASVEGSRKTLNRRSSGNRAPYEADFDTNEGGTEITFSFERGDIDDDAPNSVVELPEDFTARLADGQDSDDIQRGTDVRVEWDNESAGSMRWEMAGDCIWSQTGRTNDDGAFTIPSEDIEVQDLDLGEACEVTVTLERSLEGELDDAFEEGLIEAIQRRTVRFESTPSPDEFEGMGGSEN